LAWITGCERSSHKTAAVQIKDALKAYPNEEFNNSIVRLLANPDRYHGKKVRIEGNLRVEFEGTAIYYRKTTLII
jgi:hypothetical protein